MRHIGRIFAPLVLGAVAVAGVMVADTPATAAGQYDGVTIRILTRPGPCHRRAPCRTRQGVRAADRGRDTVAEVPFAEISRKSRPTGRPARTRSTWASSPRAGRGARRRRPPGRSTDYVAKDTSSTSTTSRRTSANSARRSAARPMLMVDGDFQMVYYRKDVLEKVACNRPRPGKNTSAWLQEPRPGHEWRRPGRLRLLHLQEAQRPVLLGHQTVAAPFVQTQGTAQGFHFDARR